MSGNISIAEAIRVLKEAESGAGQAGQTGQTGPVGQGATNALSGIDGPGRGKASGGKLDPKTLAFQFEMRMAQQAISLSNITDDQPANPGMGMESALMSDTMMMDALSTMARLTGQEPPMGKVVAAQPQPLPLEKAFTRNLSAEDLGSVAAMFESGEKGVAAIGFDRTGGTSYGKFQISSRAGTMNRFLTFLSERDPAMAQRLRKAGPANTGSTHGAMPAEWAKIAAESPERFEKLQTEFIKKDHYQPAREKILEQTGVDIETTRPALREALFSTAVQHGASGAARIFNQAIDKFLGKPGAQAAAPAGAKNFEQALVSEVYNKRQNQFGGSTEAVRASVRGRLKQEKDMVLAMLEKQGMSRVV